MVGLGDRRRKHDRHSVTHNAVQGAFMGEGNRDHAVQVFIEQCRQQGRLVLLHHRSEAGEIGHNERAFAVLAPQGQGLRVLLQVFDPVGRHIAGERVFDPPLLVLGAQIARHCQRQKDGQQAHAGEQGVKQQLLRPEKIARQQQQPRSSRAQESHCPHRPKPAEHHGQQQTRQAPYGGDQCVLPGGA